MKNLSKITVLAFAAFAFTFASCDTKKAENTAEETVDAAGAEIDTMSTPTEGDTATLLNEPVKDGIVDSTGTN